MWAAGIPATMMRASGLALRTTSWNAESSSLIGVSIWGPVLGVRDLVFELPVFDHLRMPLGQG